MSSPRCSSSRRLQATRAPAHAAPCLRALTFIAFIAHRDDAQIGQLQQQVADLSEKLEDAAREKTEELKTVEGEKTELKRQVDELKTTGAAQAETHAQELRKVKSAEAGKAAIKAVQSGLVPELRKQVDSLEGRLKIAATAKATATTAKETAMAAKETAERELAAAEKKLGEANAKLQENAAYEQASFCAVLCAGRLTFARRRDPRPIKLSQEHEYLRDEAIDQLSETLCKVARKAGNKFWTRAPSDGAHGIDSVLAAAPSPGTTYFTTLPIVYGRLDCDEDGSDVAIAKGETFQVHPAMGKDTAEWLLCSRGLIAFREEKRALWNRLLWIPTENVTPFAPDEPVAEAEKAELKALKAEVEELRKEPAKLRADLEKLQRAKDHERRGSRSLRKAVWRFSSAALSCPCEVCNIEVRPFLTPPYLPS